MATIPKLEEGFKLRVGTHQVKILGYLSEGGFAQIYKVRIDPMEGNSDIACLKRVIVPDKNGLNQLRKEVDVMKTLRMSRNIVRYYDSHAERLENGSYQVLVLMELCPNKSLLDFMNSKIKTKLSEPEILKIMLDISLAIYDMHKLRLIHRDIKIENVLISADHHFKLCDFGSTSSPLLPPNDQHEFQSITHDILYQTTPQYRAPEMIDLYRRLPIDEKADVWALGCFLYKLCFYTTPFESSGDIAILHASFQFLPSPQYSTDLTNLIVIMLQENPFYRPNIVQIIILLAKIMNIPFRDLKIEDYYNLGEYNFQALYDYQRKKQNEMIEQQQLYMHQQSLASNNKVPPNQDINPPLTAVKSPIYNSQTPINHIIPAQQSYKEPQQNIAEGHSNEKSPAPYSNEVLNQSNIVQDLQEQESNDDDSLVELEKLENAEERYPSLDDIVDNYSEKVTSGENKSHNSTSDGEVISSESTTKKEKRHLNREDNVPNIGLKNHSAEYEKKEAWEKLKPKMDKQAEMLADDIFSGDNSSPILRTKDNEKLFESTSRSKSRDYTDPLNLDRLSKSHEEMYNLSDKKSEKHVDSLDIPNEANLPDNSIAIGNEKDKDVVFTDYKKNLSSEKMTEARFPPIDVKGNGNNLSTMNPFPINQPHPKTSKVEPNINSDFKKAYNPWGEYRQTSGTPKNAPNSPSLKMDLTSIPLSKQLQSFNIQDNGNNLSQKPVTSTSKKEKGGIIESNLIDLEVGLNSSSTASLPALMNHKKNNKELLNISDRDVSVIDLSDDDDDDDKVEGEHNEPKPHFKKRIPSIQAPSSFSLHEEVIDFASDDENPENSSKMSRINIRNSLKKPKRKSGEHRRTESLTLDKKKIGMFGQKES